MKKKKSARECEDCGDKMKPHHPRFRCKKCGLLVCSWCIGHVHTPRGTK